MMRPGRGRDEGARMAGRNGPPADAALRTPQPALRGGGARLATAGLRPGPPRLAYLRRPEPSLRGNGGTLRGRAGDGRRHERRGPRHAVQAARQVSRLRRGPLDTLGAVARV